MWCGRAGVVGIAGASLLILGLTQIISGIYFMLMMPIFQLGSNIWTGTWSSMCGTVVATIGWTGQTMRRGQMVLVATLSVLVTNVANLVIIQVGENGVFLSKNDLRMIVGNNQENTMLIAFWLTTVVTALSIVVSFFGAQYLFCVVVRGPRVKGRMPVTRSLSEEDLHHHRQEGPDASPSLEDVLALPDPKAGSSAWVYHPEEDKTPTALYPMGLDLLSDAVEGSGRRPPARHASFATPRYARVHQRPQRAQSFAVRRDLRLPLDGSALAAAQHRPPPPVVMCPELPASPPSSSSSSQYARPQARRIHRSNSVSGRLLLSDDDDDHSHRTATLSRKFHACSLDDLEVGAVIEVGTFPRDRSLSEHSLVSTFRELPPGGSASVVASVHRAATVRERLLDGKKVLTSFGPVVGRTQSAASAVRIVKPKGPAPPPPIKPKPRILSATTTMVHESHGDDTYPTMSDDARPDEDSRMEDEDEEEEEEVAPAPPVRTESLLREAHPGFVAKRAPASTAMDLPLPVIEENIKNTRKRPAPQPRSILPHSDGESSRESTLRRPPHPESAKPPRPDVRKPPRPSLAEKPPRLAEKNMTLARPQATSGGVGVPSKPERRRVEGEGAANLRRLEEVLTNILDGGGASLRSAKSAEDVLEGGPRGSTPDARVPKGILKKGPRPTSKYEVAHREALADSKALLEQLPRGELQRNKIVLRVPSFRTAGCQTDAYRPVRRRASCAQTNLSAAPRHREVTASVIAPSAVKAERWGKSGRREEAQEASVIDGSSSASSSSSGYSSPEVSSKEQSPPNSGPPSPASSSSAAQSDEDERRGTDTNVTVIEVNKGDGRTPPLHGVGVDPHRPPPRPPKPPRLRHMSDAAALIGRHGGLLVPVHRRPAQHLPPIYDDVFGLAALTENVMLLTEAINPVLVHSTRPRDGLDAHPTAPRVVDVIRKTLTQAQPPHAQWQDARPRPAVRTNSLSLPRPSVAPVRALRGSRSPSPSRKEEQRQQADKQDPNTSSTAAYLASLELLASHYRHQAIANAKQLQLQQRLLMQQQRQQKQQEQAKVKEAEEVPEEKQSQTPSQPTPPSEALSPIKQESEC